MLVGMKWSEISLRDVGPIGRGAIGSDRVGVFLGPNNSGKSIASRIIYGLRQLDEDALPAGPAAGPRMDDLSAEAAGSLLAPALIAKNAGIDAGDVATHGKQGGWIEVSKGEGRTLRFSFESGPGSMRHRLAWRAAAGMDVAASRDAIYVPAGRTGAVQSLLSLMQIKSDLLDTVWLAQGEGRPQGAGHAGPPAPPGTGRRRRMLAPEYLERFNDLVLEAASEGLTDEAEGLFSRLFEGSVGMDGSSPPQACCRDRRGLVGRIDSAGSGAASSFPIIAGIDRVEPGGMLIVEEPEAHMEPLSQQRMIAELVGAAAAKDVSLLFTTHSEYVVYPLLSMVERGDLKNGELGIYHFDRKPGSCTRIEKIGVSEEGKVDRELFEEALDALGTKA